MNYPKKKLWIISVISLGAALIIGFHYAILDSPLLIPIGIIEQYKAVETSVFSYIRVKPFVDLTPIENVFILAEVKSKQVEGMELNFFRRD